MPATLALRRGDASAICSITIAVLILSSPLRALHHAAPESDRIAIAAQPDGCGDACRGECQPDPQTRAAQEPPRGELCQRNKMGIDRDARLVPEVESAGSESKQAFFQQGAEIRSVERDLLEDADRERGQHGP